MEIDQAQLVYCGFGIDCRCFYFFYLGASIICLNWMTKGMSSIRDNGSGLGRFSRLIQISAERLAELLAYV
ncbi:hypothetical protein GQ457_09G016160 [Hibiscus cannabinus]